MSSRNGIRVRTIFRNLAKKHYLSAVNYFGKKLHLRCGTVLEIRHFSPMICSSKLKNKWELISRLRCELVVFLQNCVEDDENIPSLNIFEKTNKTEPNLKAVLKPCICGICSQGAFLFFIFIFIFIFLIEQTLGKPVQNKESGGNTVNLMNFEIRKLSCMASGKKCFS